MYTSGCARMTAGGSDNLRIFFHALMNPLLPAIVVSAPVILAVRFKQYLAEFSSLRRYARP